MHQHDYAPTSNDANPAEGAGKGLIKTRWLDVPKILNLGLNLDWPILANKLSWQLSVYIYIRAVSPSFALGAMSQSLRSNREATIAGWKLFPIPRIRLLRHGLRLIDFLKLQGPSGVSLQYNQTMINSNHRAKFWNRVLEMKQPTSIQMCRGVDQNTMSVKPRLTHTCQ